MKCRMLAVLLCLTTLVACSKPKTIPTTTKLPDIQEPEYRTEKLAPDTSVTDLIVAMGLDLKEAKAALKRALAYIRSTQDSVKEKPK